MKIKLQSSYKSISPFESVDLPSFSVVVGLNGTGKSQLLEGIQFRKVQCDALEIELAIMPDEAHPAVVRLTNASLTLHSEMFDRSKSLSSALPQMIFDGHREAVFNKWLSK